jgi:hypothetical protein
MSRELDKFRKTLGLPIYKEEMVKCLGIRLDGTYCNNTFLSFDRKLNRICPICKTERENEDKLLQQDVYWESIDTINIELDEDYFDFVISEGQNKQI